MDTTSTAPKNSLGKRIKRYAIWTSIIAVLLFALVSAYATMGSYSEGFRVGNVIKLSHKGMVFKTWEGQLDQGYITQNVDGINTRLWDFSVHNSDEAARQAIDKAITQNRKVKLYYKEKFIRVFFLGDTKYYIYKVEEVR